MADRMLVTPPDVIQQMTEDLRVVADVPLEILREIGNLISQQSGFFDDRSLAALLAKYSVLVQRVSEFS